MALARLSRWCYQRRRLVVVLWIIVLIVLTVAGKAIGDAYSNNFSGGKSDSSAAFDLLKARFPSRAGDTTDVVFSSPSGVADATVRSRMESLFARVGPGQVAHVVALDSPYQDSGRISADGKIAYATVTFDEQAGDLPAKAAQPLIDAAKRARSPELKVELDGPVVSRAIPTSTGTSERIGLLAAVIILFIAFGSLLAMSLPILAALFGIGSGSALVVLLSHVMTVPSFAPQIAVMIGLGVGIDYALFIIVRYRTGLHDGLDPESADILALTTAGRAVLFAGCTVVISLLGMFMMGINFIYGLSLGAILAVLLVLLASETLVPAIIGFAGSKLANRQRTQRHHRDTWAFRWSRQIQARPWPMALSSLAVLVVLALPLLSIHLGVADQGNDPPSQTTRQAYDLLATGFGPGFNGPILLAGRLGGATTPATVTNLANAVRADADVATVVPPRISPTGDAAMVTVVPRGAPQDRSTEHLVHRLRSEIRLRGLTMHVGSETAIGIDAADYVGQRLPYMIGAVIFLSLLLLIAVFRSIAVAVKAGIMNLLSIGAAYGVIVAIFQWGWLKNIVNIGRPGPIEFWVPMMMFPILFGLSMDYEVFLLSRVREEYLISRDNGTAVADGLASTARVITAAAAIMIAVFLSFVLGDVRVLKLMGLGLATAIFVDATLVRMVLVPATMELLGDANWWLPRWLDRLMPRISVEVRPEFVPEPAGVAAPGRVAEPAPVVTGAPS
jgi:RND superfamily putative drug exporter